MKTPYSHRHMLEALTAQFDAHYNVRFMTKDQLEKDYGCDPPECLVRLENRSSRCDIFMNGDVVLMTSPGDVDDIETTTIHADGHNRHYRAGRQLRAWLRGD